jgi:hypothetical protein
LARGLIIKGTIKAAPNWELQAVTFKILESRRRYLAKMLKSAHERATPSIRISPNRVVFPNPGCENPPSITKKTPRNAKTIPIDDLRVTLSMRKTLARRAAKMGVADMRREALDAVVNFNP